VTRSGSVAVLGLLSADVERAREFVARELGPLDADKRRNGAAASDAISLAVAPPDER
jgi:hypothetical protein